VHTQPAVRRDQITSAPNGDRFFSLPGGDPESAPQDQFLFGTGGTGLPYTLGPDTRIANIFALPPGPFRLTGPSGPFDTFTADMSSAAVRHRRPDLVFPGGRVE
jgi:hypothetical protein